MFTQTQEDTVFRVLRLQQANPSNTLQLIIEVHSGRYLSEYDIELFQDTYGRTNQ